METTSTTNTSSTPSARVLTLADFTRATVARVYSGKPGCMCGCLGIYRYAPEVDRDEAARRQGYAVSPEEFNGGQITRILNELRAAPPEELVFDHEHGHVSYDTERRTVVAYLSL